MMRVAMISEHASPLAWLGGADSGGQNVYVGQLARHMASRGHLVDVFTRRDDPALPDILPWQKGVRLIHVSAGPAEPVRKEELLPLMDEFSLGTQRFCIGDGGYHLAHANFFMSGLVAADLKRLLDLPFVVTFHALARVRKLHQGAADEFPEERAVIEESIISEADRVIAECPQDLADLVDLYGADSANIQIIPCGFDPEEFWPIDRAVARRELGLPQHERLILQLGRMVPRKGIETVVRSLARLRDRYGLPARLLVVGGETRDADPQATPEIGRLQRVAREEHVADDVTFVGNRSRAELRLWYSAADVFVTTPWYEPFGITPLEAMACGVPVIGSAVGGIKLSVADGETGFLVPPRDPAVLADRLAWLFQHPHMLQSFGRNALQRVHRLFTWERVASAVERLYQDVVARHRSNKQQSPAAVHEAITS